MLHRYTHDLIISSGVSPELIPPVCTAVNVALTILVGVAFYLLTNKVLIPPISKRIKKSSTTADDIFLDNRILLAISLVGNVWIVMLMLPDAFAHYPQSLPVYTKISRLLMIALVAWLLTLEVSAVTKYLLEGDEKRRGVLVFRNILNVVICAVAFLLAVSTLMGRDIAYVITYLGAATAAVMFVFKDSILGMVAGIRLTFNRMVKVGDWISVPKHNMEGAIEDITLTAVKIRNWDESVSTIPPYTLVSDGFTNRQEMITQGIRELKVKLYIDINSVRTITTEELEKLQGKKWAEKIDLGRPQVNLLLYRRFMTYVIRRHPLMSPHPRHMVRELPVTDRGIPVEMYFFVRCVGWEDFEELAADFHDEAVASLHRFGLRHYQLPTGHDLNHAMQAGRRLSDHAQQPQKLD